jgi:signal transduction histidine kinase
MDQYDKALEFVTIGLEYLDNYPDLFFENSAREMKVKAWKNLATIYKAKGNYNLALQYFSMYHHDQVQILTENFDKDISEYFVAYDTKTKEIENEVLKKDKIISDLKLERRNLGLLILLLGIFIMMVIASIILYRYRLKSKLAKMLEVEIENALEEHKKQQQIIFHQASLTSLGEMMAGIAHEINQPLQDLILLAETASRDLEKNRLNEDNLHILLKDQIRDIEIIKQIISHVQLFSSQQKTGKTENFEINKPIMDALSMMDKQLKRKGITIELVLQEDLPEIPGNPYKFEQVVVNLLNNARYALEAKDKIQPEGLIKKIIIKTWLDNGELFLETTDTGIGIPEGKLNKIFQPFFSTKELGKGIGLGLSISLDIIKEMNGTINVRSIEGEGSTFIVRIPVQ